MADDISQVRIRSQSDLLRLADQVCSMDGRLAVGFDKVGTLPNRLRPANFETLLSIIVSQQVSLASAAAIWKRVENVLPRITPEAYLALPAPCIDKLGLSQQKKTYAEGLARDVVDGRLRFRAMHHMDDEEALQHLLAVKGIGRWSSEVFLLFALGRPNVWPAQDIALQVAVEKLYGLSSRPDVGEMDQLAEKWLPWRGVAAQILWAYYRHIMANP